MTAKRAQVSNDVWNSYAERLAFGLFISKPRKDIVLLDLVLEAEQLGVDHDTLFDGFTKLKSRGVLKVLFAGRHATSVALSEYDDEAFEPVFGATDVHSALSAYLDHPRPVHA